MEIKIQKKILNIPLKLTQASFQHGKCREWVDSWQEEQDKEIVLAEYYYYTGQPEQAIELAEKYIDNHDLMVRISAWAILVFGGISKGKAILSKEKVLQLQKQLETKGIFDSEETQIAWIFLIATAKIAFDLDIDDIPSVSRSLGRLSESVRMFGCYLMAQESYFQKKYEKSLGIIETAFAIHNQNYPILFIYLYLVAASDAIHQKNIELGKRYFQKAWDYASPDGLLEPIGQYHSALLGLVEVCIREKYPEEYKKIMELAVRFARGWLKVHNRGVVWDFPLTGMEYAVAMLAKNKWSNQEIATYLRISVRTVKYYMTSVFTKLGISSRKELMDHLPD